MTRTLREVIGAVQAEQRAKIAAAYRQKLTAKKKKRQLEEAKRVMEASVNAAVSAGTAPTAAHCRLMLNDGCSSIRRAAAAFASSTRPRRASAATRPI
jgi:hypothetical protein